MFQDSAEVHESIQADGAEAKKELEDFRLEAFKHMAAPGSTQAKISA